MNVLQLLLLVLLQQFVQKLPLKTRGIWTKDSFRGNDLPLPISPNHLTLDWLFHEPFLAVNPTNFNENNVVVFKQNEQIHVETSLVKMKSVQIFDLQGRLVMSNNDINSQSAVLQKVGLANQVLMMQITSIDGVIVNKKIIF